MTCPLIHYFKYLLRFQQCQMKDGSTMKQEWQKEIKLLLKKNMNPVAMLTKGKGWWWWKAFMCFTVDQETRRQPLLPHRCSLTSPPPVCSHVSAVSTRAGRCDRHRSDQGSVRGAACQFTAETSRYLRTANLWKPIVLVLPQVPGHSALEDVFRSSRRCSACSVTLV